MLENGTRIATPHPFGLADYAVTITGGQVLDNIFALGAGPRRPAGRAEPAVRRRCSAAGRRRPAVLWRTLRPSAPTAERRTVPASSSPCSSPTGCSGGRRRTRPPRGEGTSVAEAGPSCSPRRRSSAALPADFPVAVGAAAGGRADGGRGGRGVRARQRPRAGDGRRTCSCTSAPPCPRPACSSAATRTSGRAGELTFLGGGSRGSADGRRPCAARRAAAQFTLGARATR